MVYHLNKDTVDSENGTINNYTRTAGIGQDRWSGTVTPPTLQMRN